VKVKILPDPEIHERSRSQHVQMLVVLPVPGGAFWIGKLQKRSKLRQAGRSKRLVTYGGMYSKALIGLGQNTSAFCQIRGSAVSEIAS